MRLLAISDLHLGHAANRRALEALPAHPEDWLILAGDTGESEAHLEFALGVLSGRFARLVWVPGNHDLWIPPHERHRTDSVEKYARLVALCRAYGAYTPEDAFPVWSGAAGTFVVAPMLLLYDYSFRPAGVAAEAAVAWAAASGVLCADEAFLRPGPYGSVGAWCAARCAYTEARLRGVAGAGRLVLVNHFPLRWDLARLARIPRFSIWCGTRRTEDWHARFAAAVVVSGHLHRRATDVRDGVRFEEVSLGYPKDWDQARGLAAYLRDILPA